MTTAETTEPAIVDGVHAGPEAWSSQAVSGPLAGATAVLGDHMPVGEGPPPGWRPVAGASAVWHG